MNHQVGIKARVSGWSPSTSATSFIVTNHSHDFGGAGYVTSKLDFERHS